MVQNVEVSEFAKEREIFKNLNRLHDIRYNKSLADFEIIIPSTKTSFSTIRYLLDSAQIRACQFASSPKDLKIREISVLKIPKPKRHLGKGSRYVDPRKDEVWAVLRLLYKSLPS